MNKEQIQVLKREFDSKYNRHLHLLRERDEMNDGLLEIQKMIDDSANYLETLNQNLNFEESNSE